MYDHEHDRREQEVARLLCWARNLREWGYPVQAIEACLRAIHLAPDQDAARQELATARQEMQQLEQVVADCERRLASQPHDRATLLELVDTLKFLDRKAEACAALQQMLAIDATDAEALFHLGGLLNDRSEYEDALVAYRRLADLIPDSGYPLACQGMVLCNMGRYEEALEVLDQAIVLSSWEILGWTEKVRALRALGRDEAAEQAYKQERAVRRASGVLRWMPRGEMN